MRCPLESRSIRADGSVLAALRQALRSPWEKSVESWSVFAPAVAAGTLAGAAGLVFWRKARARRAGRLEFHDVTDFVLTAIAEAREAERKRPDGTAP